MNIHVRILGSSMSEPDKIVRKPIQYEPNQCNGIEMWIGPLPCLSLSSVIVVDKDQDSQSGIGSLLLLFPGCE